MDSAQKPPSPSPDMLVERKLFAGARVRRLRRELRLTQAAMAETLGISTSYLNLIERDQRPISAQILIRLIDAFDVDPRGLSGDEEARAIIQWREVFADPMFRDTQLSQAELRELAAASPIAADAIARLYQAYQQANTTNSLLADRMSERGDGEELGLVMAVEDVRDFIVQQNNHFPQLDEGGEALFDDGLRDSDDPYLALRERLAARHNVATRIAPIDVMGDTLRRYDRHRQTLFLSELLDQPGRSFQLAYQLAYFEHIHVIEDIILSSALTSDAARTLARIALANYFAAATLMPYERFLATATRTQYDVTLLGRRFGTSFEQVCHRLTTLQRPGARGIPFFLIRVDKAGNISKRFAAAGFHFSRHGGTCPRWNLHDAFRIPGQISTQIIRMEDNTRYFSLARTVSRTNSGFGVQDDQFTIGLGCEISHAAQLVYAQQHDLDNEATDTPIGINCRLCARRNCAQRAAPSIHGKPEFDEHVRSLSSFGG